ncbi:MAG: hypothetical protein IPM23_03615 [Candidatus Melainabacteria bacterium]|nr:hypothetical protein [Candidatus Melainabacteria bacterium]
MRILVVEDTVMMAKSFIEMLESAGHQVDWVIGFTDAENLIAMAADKSELEVEPSRYDLVLMDGDLEGKITGADVVPAFARAGVACFGTSTMPKMNDEMIASGAVYAAAKVTIFFALYHGRVNADELVESGTKTRDRLQAAWTECKDDETLRKAAEQFLLAHVQ